MQFRSKQIAPPKEWGAFEDLCHALFKRVWQDPLAQKNGRRGQAQHGVDVFGSVNEDRRYYRGVQCKGKETNYGSKVEWPEVLEELAKAEKFSPQLEEWIFATTAPVDANLQKSARELSVERKASGLFTVNVLGWEEILALMADAPEVIKEFYPEHADYLPDVIDALRALPSLEEKLSSLFEQLTQTSNPHGLAVWDVVTFEGNRGIGPALMGYSLGPSDAAACPQLPEVNSILAQVKIAYSARLIGQPGGGKSICSYQAAMELAGKGFEVLRLLDPQADNISIEAAPSGKCRLYLIDDAHLLKPYVLERLEQQAGADSVVLSTHNALEHVTHRGAIALDAKRAVKTIAAALRADLPSTLKAVRLADDHVGERMMDSDLSERLDHAESVSEFPWQFCFVLGGGWRRSKVAADSARAAGNDLILAATAIRQVASRDARATPAEIAQLTAHAGIDQERAARGLQWLEKQRLIISNADCRTPHQRFASVVLSRILEGQDKNGRMKVAAMIEDVLCDTQFPIAGLRNLLHELRFSGSDYRWTRLLTQTSVMAAVARCWSAAPSDIGFAAAALSDLCDFAEGGARAVMEPNVTTLAKWISKPGEGAYSIGLLLLNLPQENRDIAAKALSAVDPIEIAKAYSHASPTTAYGLAGLLSGIANMEVKDFNYKFVAALDRDKMRELARHEAFLEQSYVFAKYCESVVRWDQELALEMAEVFIPTAQTILAKEPIEGFRQLDDIASSVLRVFDVLGVYVGNLSPNRRQWQIARRMCKNIDPELVAEYISSVPARHFQKASFFLHFLRRTVPAKYEAVLPKLNWEKLDKNIGSDWADLPHDTEVLLGTLCLGASTRGLVQKFITERADRIVHFPPRLMLMVPDVGLAHIAKGGSLRLRGYDHISWDFGGIALAIIADKRPDLVEKVVSPVVELFARKLTNYNRDHTGPAEGFVRVVIEHAPVSWRELLTQLDPIAVEKNFTECLTKDADHRRTVAITIESAISLEGPIGDVARRLRVKFPKASVPPIDTRFSRRHGRTRRRRKQKRMNR